LGASPNFDHQKKAGSSQAEEMSGTAAHVSDEKFAEVRSLRDEQLVELTAAIALENLTRDFIVDSE